LVSVFAGSGAAGAEGLGATRFGTMEFSPLNGAWLSGGFRQGSGKLRSFEKVSPGNIESVSSQRFGRSWCAVSEAVGSGCGGGCYESSRHLSSPAGREFGLVFSRMWRRFLLDDSDAGICLVFCPPLDTPYHWKYGRFCAVTNN